MAEITSETSKGSIDPSLLAILCCPETKQPVSLIDEEQLTTLTRPLRKNGYGKYLLQLLK